MSISETVQSPGEQGHRIPLSANQQFLCLFDKGEAEGALGPRHLVVAGWRLSGSVDAEVLQGALDDVVERHQSLRTTIVRDEGNEHQQIHPPSSPRLVVRDLLDDSRPRSVRAEEFINEIEAGRISVDQVPLLTAGLGRLGERDHILVLAAHHAASDGWSMNLLARDVAHFYAVRKGLAPAELPEIRQYGDYAEWQQENAADPGGEICREYWQNKLGGGQLLPLPTDRPLTPGEVGVYSVHRFSIDKETTSAALALSRTTRSSPFIVLFSVFNLLLNRRTGVTDVLVPTLTSGRVEPQFQDTVGVFFNFIPVRTDLADCGTFREIVNQVRQSCLEAYSYEIPFLHIVGQAPEITSSMGPDRALFALQAFQFPPGLDGDLVGDVRYAEVRNRLLSDSNSCDIPDGALWTLDIIPSGETIGSLRFNRNLFDASTIIGIVEEFDRLLRNAITSPDAPLNQL